MAGVEHLQFPSYREPVQHVQAERQVLETVEGLKAKDENASPSELQKKVLQHQIAYGEGPPVTEGLYRRTLPRPRKVCFRLPATALHQLTHTSFSTRFGSSS